LSKKAIVSACLLGEFCRYDGKTKKDNAVVEALEEYVVIPFCPEAPLFGTPRERIDVYEIDGEWHIITDETKKDVTKQLREEIQSFIAKHPEANRIVLKSKSPSCGLGTTPVYDRDRNLLRYGNGLAAEIFLKHYKGSDISDEHGL